MRATMTARTTTVEVYEADRGEHVVQIVIAGDGTGIGKAQLPGGDYGTALAIAEGLKTLTTRGVDLTPMLPDADREVRP